MRTKYRIEWRMRGERKWTELGAEGGRADTFRTRREAEKKCRWLEERQFGGVVTRIIQPPRRKARHA